MPAKISQQVLRLLDKNWKSFFKANKAYKLTPNKFKARLKLSNYKHKTKGRNILFYTSQAISNPQLKQRKHWHQYLQQDRAYEIEYSVFRKCAVNYISQKTNILKSILSFVLRTRILS